MKIILNIHLYFDNIILVFTITGNDVQMVIKLKLNITFLQYSVKTKHGFALNRFAF